MRERKEMDWDEVNDEIKEAPFCENDQELQRSRFAVIAPFVAKTDSVTSVIKIEKTTISATPTPHMAPTTKTFRNFTERRRYNLCSRQ